MREAVSRSGSSSECAACGVHLTADASFCQGCGCPVPGAPVPDTFDGRSSGTCCRGCGASLDSSRVICPVCGRRATRRRRTPRAAAGGATLAGVPAGGRAVLDDLDALWTDHSLRLIVLPHAAPAIGAAALITFAVSLDEYAIAWFVGGLEQTVPVTVLNTLQGQVDPTIHVIGTLAFAATLSLVFAAQLLLLGSTKSHKNKEVSP